LKVIPVIDILNGVAVHAVRGKRKEYKPLQSSICQSIDPVHIAKEFKALGFTELYVADLDAITKKTSSLEVLRQIIDDTKLKLMVDEGVTTLESAQKLLEAGVSKVIVGTETLLSKRFVEQAVSAFGSNRIVVSLDMKGKKILVKMGFDGCQNALCLLKDFESMGVSQVIVLDLARVGSDEGVNTAFLGHVFANLKMRVYAGGGVRNMADLVELENLGVSGVLLATALHSGKITAEQLRKSGFL
jgi:phosphoribosylformimino-5-aminoimidazole carboxamide ribotide isomerase